MNNSATYLLAALREKIKEKGICYAELSIGTGIPLSTIKRQLHNTALGLDKILYYASHLDTDLVELSQRGRQLQLENEQFITDVNSDIFHQFLTFSTFYIYFVVMSGHWKRSPKSTP